MTKDDENKDKQLDELGELLRKYYKPENEIDPEDLWEKISDNIDSLFHKEIMSDPYYKADGEISNTEDCYWKGLDDYINNKLSSLKHKIITDHLLKCSECRKNYVEMVDKKKVLSCL